MTLMRLRLGIAALIALGSVAACGSNLVLPDDDSPAGLTVISGNPQEGTIGSYLDLPLVVRVTDARSQPLAGIPVTFRFRSDDPRAQVDSQAVTNLDGRASAKVRLGMDLGVHVVEAQVAQTAASELRVTFDLTAVAREKGNNGKDGHGKEEKD
jgi:hypothetical protein